jgi:penicillin amidase
LNVARFAHPLAGEPQAAARFAVPAVEVGADGECPFSARSVADFISSQQTAMLGAASARSAIFGASARMIWDVGDWDCSSLLLNLGQSGNPDSAHYCDQLQAWKSGAVQHVPFSAERVRAECIRHVVLQPQAPSQVRSLPAALPTGATPA